MKLRKSVSHIYNYFITILKGGFIMNSKEKNRKVDPTAFGDELSNEDLENIAGGSISPMRLFRKPPWMVTLYGISPPYGMLYGISPIYSG